MDLGKLKKKIETYFREERGGYYEWKGLRYFLYEYEDNLRKKEGVDSKIKWNDFIKYEKDKISIEHILPQDTKNVKEWSEILKNALKETRGQNRKRLEHQLINSLGNLVPLKQSINSGLRNKPYSEKIQRYMKGSQSEIEISQTKKWDKNAIVKRSKRLLDFMLERWEINDIIKYWEENDEKEWAKEQREMQEKLIFSI